MFHTLTRPHGRHGRLVFRTLFTLTLVLAGWGGLTRLGLNARAADPHAPGAVPLVGDRMSDIILARAVLQAFDADPVLRDANLVVSVVDGVAVIGGPVPTADAARRAGDLVGAIRDVKDVQNKCFVQVGSDPLLLAMAGRFTPAPPRPVPFGLPGIVSSPRTGVTVDEPASDPADSLFAASDPPERSVVVRRPANPGENILLPPVGLNETARPSRPPVVPPTFLTSVPPAQAVATIPGRPADALTLAEAVRKADRRFAGLTLEIRDDMLVIAGSAERTTDAWELARQLDHVPGVARVAVGQVAVR